MNDLERPAALVLTGGGARGAYQAGVLAGIAERSGCDVCFPIITGVSAGGINAAGLAGHRGDFASAARTLTDAWSNLSVDEVFRSNFATLTASFVRWALKVGTGGKAPFELRGLLDTAPLRAYLEEVIDFPGIAANLAAGRLRSLALTMTEYATGNTVTVVQGAGELPDWQRARRRSVHGQIGIEHVMASAALPLVFPAVQVGDDYFGDGSIRQAAPLAPAVHLGAGRILAISVRYEMSPRERSVPQVIGYPPPAQILGMIMHGVFIDALENDVERAERINRTLQILRATGSVSPDGLRPVKILLLRPSRDLGRLGADLVPTLPRGLRVLARGLGADETTSPDFLSYLLFERPYLERVLELGHRDAGAQWERIEPFLAAIT